MRLQCRNLTYAYPGTETPVFSALSFTLPTSGFHALFGPSGVGKTTLAAILSGAASGYTGEIRMDADTAVLYTCNTERLPGWSSVGRHLEKVCPADRKDRLRRLADVFGVSECLVRRFPQLSLGQKNRVNLIRYLVQDFDLLIMDESLANVDEMTRERIILFIKSAFPRRGFLYISHNIVEVARCCRKVVVVRGEGKSPAAATVDGMDLTEGGATDANRQNRVMLEIMNAV